MAIPLFRARTREVIFARSVTDHRMTPFRMEDIFLFLALNEYLFLGLNEPVGHGEPASAFRRFLDLCIAAFAATLAAVPRRVSEPDTVLALRRTLGHELAGLPTKTGDR
jgi:hypothetical protein